MNPEIDWSFVAELVFILLLFIRVARPLGRVYSEGNAIGDRDTVTVTIACLVMMTYIVVTLLARMPGGW